MTALRKVDQRLKSTTTGKSGDANHDDDALIGARKTRELLDNCSETHIWRLLNVESYAALKFPRPIKIKTRNYWRRADIVGWIKAQARRARREAAL